MIQIVVSFTILALWNVSLYQIAQVLRQWRWRNLFAISNMFDNWIVKVVLKWPLERQSSSLNRRKTLRKFDVEEEVKIATKEKRLGELVTRTYLSLEIWKRISSMQLNSRFCCILFAFNMFLYCKICEFCILLKGAS